MYSLPSAALGKGFAECNLAFVERLRHSAKNLNPVVVRVAERPATNVPNRVRIAERPATSVPNRIRVAKRPATNVPNRIRVAEPPATATTSTRVLYKL